MPRYKQIQNEDGSFEYVEVGKDGLPTLDIIVQKDFDAFRSNVDGSVIASRRDLAAHNQRNNVVHASEFGTDSGRKEYFAHKLKERNDLRDGTQRTAYGRQLARERRADILDAIKRNGG